MPFTGGCWAATGAPAGLAGVAAGAAAAGAGAIVGAAFGAAAGAAEPTVTIDVILSMVPLGTPAFDRSATVAYGRPAMIFFAVAGPTKHVRT